MAELVYRPVIAAALVAFRALDLRMTIDGAENIPRSGGAILASNHVSYLDFIIVGAAGLKSKRLTRFMAKKEIFAHWLAGPLMRGMGHISVDREAGAASYKQALTKLSDGEVVGLFPEATISLSFTVKQLKNGAGRMAIDSGTPLIPIGIWGGQRIWTKHRKPTFKRHVRVNVVVGTPIVAQDGESLGSVTTRLSDAVKALVAEAQLRSPMEPIEGDDWWMPAALGGSAPTPEEGAAMDKAERIAEPS